MGVWVAGLAVLAVWLTFRFEPFCPACTCSPGLASPLERHEGHAMCTVEGRWLAGLGQSCWAPGGKGSRKKRPRRRPRPAAVRDPNHPLPIASLPSTYTCLCTLSYL